MVENKGLFPRQFSIEDLEVLTQHWEAFERKLVQTLHSLPVQDRFRVAMEQVSERAEENISVEDRRFYTGLADLSDDELGRMAEAIKRNESKGIYQIRTSLR
ncbi:hypothetical protein A2V80_00690 [Candidatus Woesebacteria bacterium RBG_16_39_8b]|uniref:Uncharacterized protein n=1 Tax=Candidatus Woesebacteria bacterium RBG_16_39_8b TaxID=1802482 RepID=A0A1F7XGV9_9BACT|nr:MAG: hypothetical protein A2V80_00690 [Candidatus Woesebacteria bacterium RBG_16_39_8b]